MDRLSDVQVFVHVAEAGSFARAAEQLDISRSYASRMIAGLEARLGVRLLHRTTRKVATTATGQEFYEATAPLVRGIAAAEGRARDEADTPRGTLRVSLPAAFGLRYLVRPMIQFQRLHPDITLHIGYDERKVDLLGEGIDLAIRGASTLDGPLVARGLWGFRMHVVASPSFLARHPAVGHPRDLARLPAILYQPTATPSLWTMKRGADIVDIEVHGTMSVNATEAVTAAAVEGVGIALHPDWAVTDELADGRLVRVLPDWGGPEAKFSLVRPDRRHVPQRVRAFQDFLAGLFPTPPWSATA